jgi:hypothetical protein
VKRFLRAFDGPYRCVLYLTLIWVNLIPFCWLRFHSRSVNDVSPVVRRAPLTQRVALVVLDGLREDRFSALLPQVSQRAQKSGVLCAVECPELTFTATGIYSLGTGDLPTLALLPNNFQARPAEIDSLPWAVERANGRTLLFGETVWRDLFGTHLKSGFEERDQGPFAGVREGAAQEGLRQALQQKSCDLCIWHDPHFDKLGHRFGIFSSEYESYARRVDDDLMAMVRQGGPTTTWLITSDHGMTDSGNHGGAQAQARASFLASFGPAVRHQACSSVVAQRDIAGLVSVLLGAPIPFSASSEVPDVLDGLSYRERRDLREEQVEHRLRLARRLVQRFDSVTAHRPTTSAEALNIIEAAHQEVPRGLLLLCLVPVVVALWGGLRLLPQWPKVVVWTAAVLTVWGWVFGNLVYPRCSFRVATGIYFVTALLPFLGAIISRRRRNDNQRTWLLLGIAFSVLITADSHWVIFLEPLVLVGLVWAATSEQSMLRRWLLVLVAMLVGYGLTVAGWTHALGGQNAALPRGFGVLWGMVAGGLYGAWIHAEKGVRSRVVTGLCFAGGYLASQFVPVALRPLWPVAVTTLVLVGLRWTAPAIRRADALILGCATLYAIQMGPVEWSVVLLAGACVGKFLTAPGLRRTVGADGAIVLRGAALLSLGYLWVVCQGNQLDFSDVRVLSGLLGGAVPLYLPLVVGLTALYYAAPVLLALGVWFRSHPDYRLFRGVTRAATTMVVLRLVFHLVGFTWGRMAWGSWEKQLLEVLLLLTWLHAIELSVVILGKPSHVTSWALVPRRTAQVSVFP